MSSIFDWSQTASDNSGSDSAIDWTEGMNSKKVNDSSRQMMGRVAELLSDIGGQGTVGGSANAITLSLASGFSALTDGLVCMLLPTADNSGAVTLNVNSIGAKAIRKFDPTGDVALASGDLQAGMFYLLIYSSDANSSSGAWVCLNPTPAVYQAASSKLTDIAALTPTDSNFIVGNGTTWVAETGSTVRTSLGLGTAATTDATAYATAAQGSKADTALQSVASATTSAQGIVELATTAEAQTGTDTARAVTPAALAGVAIGVGQTWQDVLASRAANTVYHNTTGRPIMVAVEGDTVSLFVSSDNSTFVKVGVGVTTGHQAQYVIVPNGHYYKTSNNTPTLWAELR